PVAQLDRAVASGATGREFESLRAHQFYASLLVFPSWFPPIVATLFETSLAGSRRLPDERIASPYSHQTKPLLGTSTPFLKALLFYWEHYRFCGLGTAKTDR